jgi:mannose/fructose-specific phosphotransferase system component IIA
MSDGLRGIVVAHGALAAALVQEAERISGQSGALLPVSNQDGSGEEIERRIAAAIAGHPSVVFVDMPCGSCFFAAMHLAKERADIRVVTGVNLPMLLDFVYNHAMPPAEVAERAAVKGTDAIRKP